MDTLLQDLRYAARTLLRRPGFAAVVVLTLALGIGANSAIFSVVNSVLLNPLPYANPERLVMVWGRYPDFGRVSTSLPDFRDWRERTRSFAQLAAWHGTIFNLTGDGSEPQQLTADRVTANYFATLGVRPALGRAFTAEEERAGGNDDVVVLSHGLWQSRFGGDPGIVGRQINLSGRPYTVVGVAPKAFRFWHDVDLWAPLRADTAAYSRRAEYLTVFGRLKPGVTVRQAASDLADVVRQLAAQYPETNTVLRSEVVSMHKDVVGKVRPALLVFSGAVGFVLLIACANVANLMLTRAASREREIAIRATLGAAQSRLVRQALTESVLLAVAGGVLGLLFASLGVDALRSSGLDVVPRLAEVSLDARVVGFTLLLSLLTGLLFGLAPALRFASDDLQSTLREGARGASAGAAARRLRDALVLAEVALALVLLVGAGLLVRSFQQLNRVDPGFDPERVLTYGVILPRAKYGEGSRLPAVYDALLERTRGVPGVRAAAVSTSLPMESPPYTTYSVEGRPEPRVGEIQDVQPFQVSPDYFRVLGIKLRRGRLLDERDGPQSQRVAVINVEMARRVWPGQDPIGAHITFDDPSDTAAVWWTVVGVVGTVAQEGLTAKPYAQLYRPIAQGESRAVWVSMRTAGDPLAAAAGARQALKAVDPDLPLNDLRTMEQRIAETVAQPRVSVALLGVFAAVALALAAIGIYGVVSYGVAQRTREIGIRMALGAKPADVLRLVIRQGMTPVAAGVALGIVGAFAATRAMATLLYGVSATDPMTFAVVAVFLAAVALVATYLPARRAMGVPPTEALRYE